MRRLFARDLLFELNSLRYPGAQAGSEHLEWIGSDIVDLTCVFIDNNKLLNSYFIKGMNTIFKTNRFEILLKKWLVEYFLNLFRIIGSLKEVTLEDNQLNKFGVAAYRGKFGALPKIKWRNEPNLLQKIFSILLRCPSVFYSSLNNGIKLSRKKRKYKVMREAIWGLYDVGGYYFHDDFMVDGDKIIKDDIVLFSRGVPIESGRFKGYQDAKKSPYAHFNLMSLSVGLDTLLLRVIPKYIYSSCRLLFKEVSSDYFTIFYSIYIYFIHNALPYEKVFSHFEIGCELGHAYFSPSHIPESIVCQSHKARYYLMHWSDHTLSSNKYLFYFLGCDRFLLWGNAHGQGVKEDNGIFVPIGYIFKRFIKKVMSNRNNRNKVLTDMGIRAKGKIISFFDESFGDECKMTGENCVTFWETVLDFAALEKDITILVKPKSSSKYNGLCSNLLKERFISIKNSLGKMPNVYVINPDKWSFIEVIGISDVVVSQGMTSSSTIAIICGIQGLYLDQARYEHPFSRLFKDTIVFEEPKKLLSMVQSIIKGKSNPLKSIPEDILRSYDAYADDRGIDLLRDILSTPSNIKRVAIIIQARMGSTRLPGKVIMPILGRPMLEILVERLKKSQRADLLVIATTVNPKDDVIENLSSRLGVICFRGDEDDVLNRYYEAAKKYNADIVVRITADCPLADPLLVDDLILYYLKNLSSVDYISNTIKRTYPRGFDVEIFSFESLKKAAQKATKPYQREHVTPFICENMNVLNYQDRLDASKYRVTVDTIEDFELITHIYKYFADINFNYKQVINLLDSRLDLVAINQQVVQKEA